MAEKLGHYVTCSLCIVFSGVWSRADVRERAKVLNNIAAILRENIPRLAEMEVYQTGRAIKEMNVSCFISTCTVCACVGVHPLSAVIFCFLYVGSVGALAGMVRVFQRPHSHARRNCAPFLRSVRELC